MGCGVTAYDEAQAMEIMKQHIFNNNPVPEIARVIPDVKIDELEKNHFLPNIGNPAMRGIWFPLGYNK